MDTGCLDGTWSLSNFQAVTHFLLDMQVATSFAQLSVLVYCLRFLMTQFLFCLNSVNNIKHIYQNWTRNKEVMAI